jgi:hypothetical protein
MINIFSKQLNIGDKVKYISNSNSSNYTIGKVYNVHRLGGDTCVLIDENGREGNNAALCDIVVLKFIKIKDVLDEINIVKEFLEDYEEEEISMNMEREFKAFKLLKVIKSTKSDFEKMKIISELVK